MFWRANETALVPYDPRSAAYPAPAVGIFDEPLVGRAINSQWASFVTGVIDRLDQYDMWIGTRDEKENACNEIRKLLDALTRDECSNGGTQTMFRLRQNTDNPFILEQSLDSGISWSVAYDYSIIDRQSASITKINQLAQFVAQVNNVNLNPTFINNFISQKTFTGDESDTPERIKRNRDSLCALVRLIVDVTSDALIQYVDEESTLVDLIEDVGSAIVGSVIVALGIPAGLVGTVASTLAAAFVSFVASEAQNIAVTPFRDATARENVACAIYRQLSNVPATRPALVSAIASAGECLTTQENVIRVFVQLLFSIPGIGDNAFNDLMTLLGDARVIDAFGECECADSTTWRWTLYLTDAFAMNRQRVQLVQGQYAAKGVRATTDVGAGRVGAKIETSFSIPVGTTIDQAFVLIDADGNYDSMRAFNTWNGNTTQQNCGCFGAAYLAAKINLGDGFFSVSQAIDIAASSASGYIAGIAMTGTGANPFSACNNW